MSSFTPTSKRLACDICGDTSGKCRVHKGGEILLCMPLNNARFGEIQNGYKCIKEDKGKGWSTWKIDNTQEWTQQQRSEWKQRLEARRRQQAKQDEARASRALSERQKHEQYQKMLAELDLHPDDRADLIRRGFTNEQIELAGFKSVENWQRLKGKYSHLLPGIGIGGKRLLTGKGYLCPIRNAQGLIVACQIRLREVKSGEGRYRYLSSVTKKNPSGQSPHLYRKGFEPELPLAIHKPKGKPQGIALAEGVGVKPFLVSQRLNLFTIGAAGGQWASSPNLLKESLEKAFGETGVREVRIFPDAGDILNKSVMNRWERVISLLEEWGWSAQVGWWNQRDKSGQDIDELTDYSKIEYISPQEFLNLTSPKAKPDKKSAAWRYWIKSRQFTPTHSINQRFFDFPVNIPLSDAIIAGRDGLGGGKTSALIRFLARLGLGSRLIGYRNTLLHQTIARFQQDAGIPYYHLRDDDSFLLLKDKDSHIAFCLDSITHSQSHWFQNTVLIMDETVSILLHGVSAGTIGDRQSECLALLREALSECELVICLDGNLRDIDIDLIQKLSGGKQVVKVLNNYKREGHQITFVNGVDPDGELKKGNRSPLVKAMLEPNCKPWVCCDSKDRALAYALMLKQTGKKGFVLCHDTKKEPWAKEFLFDPTAFIQRYKPDYMFLSPSGESGLDCHGNGHFTHKFSFFSGVVATNTQNQMMFRLRDKIPHYVFCSEVGMVPDRNTPRTYSAKQFEQACNEFVQQSADLVLKPGKDFVQGITQSMLSKADLDYWQYSSCLGSLDNFEIDNLRECLIYSLQESGHRVEEVEWEICPQTGEWEKEAFDTIKVTEVKEIFAAKDIPFDEAQKLKRKDGTKEERRQVQKAFFVKRLPEINQWDGWDKDVAQDEEGFPTFVSGERDNSLKGGELLLYLNKTNRNYISALERFWLLQNFDVAYKRHEKQWFTFSNKDELSKIEAKKRGTSFNTIWALKELNLLQFMEGEWCADSPEIISLEERGHGLDISMALGFSPGQVREGNPQRIEYLHKLLRLIGCRLDSPVKRGTQNRQNFYQVLTSLKESKLFEKYQKKKELIPKSLWWDDWESPLRKALTEAIDKKFTLWAVENKEELQWNPESPLNRSELAPQVNEVSECIKVSEPPTELELLIKSLADCRDICEFKSACAGYTREQVENAFLYQEIPHKQMCRGWLASIQQTQSSQPAFNQEELDRNPVTQEQLQVLRNLASESPENKSKLKEWVFWEFLLVKVEELKQWQYWQIIDDFGIAAF
ncbi:MAG: hypothetical protein F6K21_04715 [Symploca sp. SIO2D2]|nr:hypothetical protein [Symploca sp. SIO2D2]